jgi:hypothetical protein
MGDDLASCPEVECVASIGSAYVGSNHCSRQDTIHKIFETLAAHEAFACVRMSHADRIPAAAGHLDTKAMIFDQTTSIIGTCWVCFSGGVAGPRPDPSTD